MPRTKVMQFRAYPERLALLEAARDSLKVSVLDAGMSNSKVFDAALKTLILTEGGSLLKDMLPPDFDQEAKIQRVIKAYMDNQTHEDSA